MLAVDGREFSRIQQCSLAFDSNYQVHLKSFGGHTTNLKQI